MNISMQASPFGGLFKGPAAVAGPALREAAPKPAPGRRFPELEGLRGIAALLVVFYHLPFWHPAIHFLPIVDNGLLMVQLFFVLSGFVICGAYRTRIADPNALLSFQMLRLGRLYPVHLLFLLVYLAIECSKWYLASRHGIHSNNSEPFRENNWTAFVEQLLLIHPLGPTGNALSFNTPAWSIGVEFYIYLLFGLIVLFAYQRVFWIAASISFATLMLMAFGGLPDYSLLMMGLAGFFLGCVVQIVSATRHERTPLYFLPLTLAVMLCYLFVPQMSSTKLLIYPISALLIYAVVTTPDSLWRAVFRSAPLAFLGRISYSVYMAHLSMIWVVTQTVRFALSPPQAPSPNGHVDAQLTGLQALCAVGGVLVLTLTVAYLVCRFVEEPLRNATRKWIDARSNVRAYAAEAH